MQDLSDNWGNIRPLRDTDRALGEALIEFGRMIESGTAIVGRWSGFGGRAGIVEPFYREADFPAGSIVAALQSIERARKQLAKGRLSQDEAAVIIARCELAIKRMQS